MKKLTSLFFALSEKGLFKEASEVLKLRRVEHPDWESWSKEEEEELLKKVSPQITIENNKNFINNVWNKLFERAKDLGISVIPLSGKKRELGSGAFGTVFEGVYGGKRAAVKLQWGFDPISNWSKDVENWKKLQQDWGKFPEFVRNHLPEVYLTHQEAIFLPVRGEEKKIILQIIAMERLFPAPIELEESLFKTYAKVKPWMWEQALQEELYPKIWNLMQHYAVESPTISWLLKKLSSKEEFLFSTYPDNEESFDPKIDIDKLITSGEGLVEAYRDWIFSFSEVEIHSDKKEELVNKIKEIILLEEKRLEDSFPRNEGNWLSPKLGTEKFWEAVSWLRGNGIPTYDIKPGNIMINGRGQIKICDLGGIYFQPE